MNISGFQDNNFHDGSTQILGDLIIDGKLILGGATGQSEYLDSGDYKAVISNISGISNVSFDSTTRTYYEKQGNLVKLYASLKITFTATLTSSFTFNMTVPALDLFEKKINGAFCIANGGFVNQYDADGFANVLNDDGTVRVIFQRLPLNNVTLPFGGDLYGSIILIYKLVGDDIPATVLIAGGSGSGDVKNPMLENLDGGGFNIVNVDTIIATNITAPNVVTNPLNTNLNANNQNIININSVDAETLNASNTNTTVISTDTINSLIASDITFSNNIDMGTRSINNVGELKVTTLRSNSGAITTASGITFNNNNIFQLGNLQTQTISSQVGEVKFLTNLNINDNIIKGCNELNSQNGDLIIKGLTSGGTFPASKISLEAFKVDLSQCPNGLDMGNHPINNAGIITTDELRVTDISDATNTTTTNLNTNTITTVFPQTQIQINNEINMTNKSLLNTNNVQCTNTLTDNIFPRNPTGSLTFNSTDSYNFLNYVDFTTKRFNTVKYITEQGDFETPSTLSGVYVIIGNVVMTVPLVITGTCLIKGNNQLSTLTFNISDGIENTYCISNVNNSGNIELQDFIFTNQNTSTRSGIFLANSGINTNILRVSNVGFFNCKNNYPLRILGFELAEILNCTFRYNYGGSGGAMLSLNTVKNTVIESCEFYNNYQLGNTSNIYVNYLLFISGTCDNITISANQFSTYGALSLGGVSIGEFGTSINRVIVDGNIFDAQGGSDPLKLLDVNTTIHKGVICNENTGIVTCKASLEGLVNGNTVYTETQAGVWVPVDLTGFVTGIISRFTPGLSPYSFIYDASDPIKTLITVNCAADHSTGGTDTVRLGISVNGTVNVFVQADLNSGQTQSVNLTTVLNLHFGDTVQIVCQNLTAGTNANGFRAVSLNASLVEI